MSDMTNFLQNFGCRNKLLVVPRHRWKDEIKIYLKEMGCEIIERILLIMADILNVIMNRLIKGCSREGGGGSSAAAPGNRGLK
jgi:hypothetical protein